MYGVVTNVHSGANIPLRFGEITWIIKPPAGKGAPITVQASLTNLNDQFSYVLTVPFETPFANFTLSPGALGLTTDSTTYDRASVTIDGQPASFIVSAQKTFNFSAADRGRIERVDLSVSVAPLDSDHDGLPDDWELKYFGNLKNGPQDDPDKDGMDNLSEYRAGTDPTQYQSQFRFIEVTAASGVGASITWSSVPGKKYAVQRSASVISGFLDVTPAGGILAAGAETSWIDTSATGRGPYFYRLVVLTQP